MKRVTRREVEDVGDWEDLCLLVRKLGYRGVADQLLIGNGAAVSDLIEFLEDNQGAIEVIVQWIVDEGCHRDGEPIDDEEEEEEENA